MIEVQVMVDPGQYQEQVWTEIGLGVSSVESMIILQRESPTRQENRETEQIQQMFNLDKDQPTLHTQLMDTKEDVMMITPIEVRDSLNL